MTKTVFFSEDFKFFWIWIISSSFSLFRFFCKTPLIPILIISINSLCSVFDEEWVNTNIILTSSCFIICLKILYSISVNILSSVDLIKYNIICNWSFNLFISLFNSLNFSTVLIIVSSFSNPGMSYIFRGKCDTW